MPAEWAEHAATWVAWPWNREDWPGKFAPIAWVYGEIVRHLAAAERVRIVVPEEKPVERVLRAVGVDRARVDLVRAATDRSWVRDSGAIFVRDGEGRRAATQWRFNGWAKYPNWKKDALLPPRMARVAGVPLWRTDVVLEGGAIDVDGEGTLLATEECLLSDVQARNPSLDRAGVERALADGLGATRTIWLGNGIVGDDTHGHIDDVCRFVGPGRVALCAEDDPRDENHAILAENRERLASARDAAGRRLEVIPLPMPRPLAFQGQRVPASYANFYVANGLVLCPTFNDPADRVALGTLAELFPGRRVIGIHAVDLVWGLGTLHCLSQQEPAGS
jgi:agmatine deiminase